MAQVDTHRERAGPCKDFDEEDPDGFASHPLDGLDSVALFEGQVIESYRRLYGAWPPWNRIGGSRAGQVLAATAPTRQLLEVLDGRRDSAFLARRTIRELQADQTAYFYESGALHLARMQSLLFNHVSNDETVWATLRALAVDPRYSRTSVADELARITSADYLDGAPGWP